jgi:hypothetical protein
VDDNNYRLKVDIERTGLSTEFSNLFRSFASLYNAVHEEREHRHPTKSHERLRVVEVQVHSPGHVVFAGVPLITQWVDIMVNAANAAVGAAGIWLAFKVQSEADLRRRQNQILIEETERLSQQNLYILRELFVQEAMQMEHDYNLMDTQDFPTVEGSEDDEEGAPQLTFEFIRSPWGELSVNDRKGVQALGQIKAMQRRRLISHHPE